MKQVAFYTVQYPCHQGLFTICLLGGFCVAFCWCVRDREAGLWRMGTSRTMSPNFLRRLPGSLSLARVPFIYSRGACAVHSWDGKNLRYKSHFKLQSNLVKQVGQIILSFPFYKWGSCRTRAKELISSARKKQKKDFNLNLLVSKSHGYFSHAICALSCLASCLQIIIFEWIIFKGPGVRTDVQKAITVTGKSDEH